MDQSDLKRGASSQKELARELRRQAYQRAKERRAADPRHIELKEAAKKRRRALYERVKEQRKAVVAEQKQKKKEKRAEERAANDENLMKIVRRATEG